MVIITVTKKGPANRIRNSNQSPQMSAISSRVKFAFSTIACRCCCQIRPIRTRDKTALPFDRRYFGKMQSGSSTVSPSNGDNIKTFVVCGPSGSGKTTLLDMVTSFYQNCFKFCVSRKYILYNFFALFNY